MGMGLVLDRPGTASAVFRFSGTFNGYQTSSAGTVRTGQGCVIMYNERGFSADIQALVAQEYGWPK
jgi:hypothetical protein